MKFFTFLPVLLTLGVAEDVADVADVAAVGDVTIFDVYYFRGQNRPIPVNGICQDLSPPFKASCRGNYAEVVFESRVKTNIVASSIRCSKN
ncbi:hypothetical protein ARSEF4850_010096 [Beauveria asiatica]